MRRRAEGGGAPRRPVATASFAVSWDGRVLEALPTDGAGRMGVADEAKRLRELVTAGLVEELRLEWRPLILGGKSAPAITGLEEDFLPRGVSLDLLKLERKGGACVATYRVHSAKP